MDFFDSADYRFNKFVLSLIGQWPYSSVRRNNTIIVVIVITAGTQYTAKICGMMSVFADKNLFLNCLAPIIIDTISIIKMIMCITKAKQIKALLDQMQSDWGGLKVYEEIAVLRRYTDSGKRLVQMYSGYLYFAMVMFMIMPFAPQILHQGNDSDKRPMIHHIEYYVDADKYYYPILLHSYVTVVIIITICVAVDSMFIVFVSHICGIFATIGYRLDHMTKDDNICINTCPSIKDDASYKSVTECIQMHITALRFANLMESSYNIIFLLQAALNMIVLSITGVQAMENMDHPHEFFRQLTFSYAQLFHLGFESYQAQQLMDHSARVHEHLINSTWYLTSSRTKKLINFMILRSQTPCTLTAGKMFVISMKTCSSILRMSVSYFMMLRTFQ